MAYHLPQKIKNNRTRIRMLEDHKFSRIGRETLLIHLLGLHFKKQIWIGMANIKLKMKSISWTLTLPPPSSPNKNMTMLFWRGKKYL